MYNSGLNYNLPPPDINTIQQLNQTQSIETNNLKRGIDTRTHRFFYFRKTASASLISLPIVFVLFQGFMIFLFGLSVEQSVQIYKSRETEVCCDNTDCLSPMNCSINRFCECGSFQYHNPKQLRCLPQKMIDETCSKTLNCRFDKYLECRNKKCICSSLYPQWSILQEKCINPVSYNERCDQINECDLRKELVCNSGGKNCRCPQNVGNNRCDCIREYKNENYWNGTKCIIAIGYGKSCFGSQSNYMCKTMTEGTQCLGPNSFTCKCISSEYFNNFYQVCERRLSEGERCLQTDACRSDLGLICKNRVCSCDEAIQHWDIRTNKCIDSYSYDQGGCSNDKECLGNKNLVCKTGGASCRCPQNVGNNRCDCPIREIGNEFYWNGDECVSAESFNQTCNNANSNYMCKTLTEGTECLGPAPFRCRCQSREYFNNINRKCEPQGMDSDRCLQIEACRSDLGLFCTNSVCNCNSSTQFWSGTNCINYYSYNEGNCRNEIQCNNAKTNLICKTAGASCSCPQNVANNRCDCPRREIGNEYYWNGTACVEAGDYGDSCVASYQCKELTKLLRCDACSLTCMCANCLRDTFNEVCIPCISGWTCHNSACYRGHVSYKPFDATSDSYISTNCRYGTNLNVNLATVSDFSGCNAGSTSEMCSNAKVTNLFLGPVDSSGKNCPDVDCNGKIGTHDCDHGGGNHGMLCKYDGES